ncbi:pentatricopeptide repeat-containing protein [Tanacetum coccineum]
MSGVSAGGSGCLAEGDIVGVMDEGCGGGVERLRKTNKCARSVTRSLEKHFKAGFSRSNYKYIWCGTHYEGMWVRIAMLYSQAGMVDNALKVFDEMLERKPWDFKEQSICGVVSVLLGNGFLVRGWIGCLRSMWRRRG